MWMCSFIQSGDCFFIKCSDDKWRDSLGEILQSQEGVIWKEYGVRVKGYSLDSQIKYIRLLGASRETKGEEIKKKCSVILA